MAGDWIKMRVALPEDPAVIGIAEATGLDEFGVVGRLHRVWSWADQQSRDGNAACVTEKWLDRYVVRDGFAKAMIAAGWLLVTPGGVSFPNFDRHNGKSAKNRALTQDRQVTHRSRKRNAESVTKSLPEKRREEIEPREELRSSPEGGDGGVCDLTPTNPTPSETSTGPAWRAYGLAYMRRYQAMPKRNARVNSQMAKFVRLVGEGEAPGIVEFYLGHSDARYVREGHSVGMLVAHAEKLHTEWSTGRKVTLTSAGQADRVQATGEVFGRLIQEAHERENS